jgi:hypothetical protein
MSETIAATPYMYKIEYSMQICLRNLRIACNTDHVLQLPLGETYVIYFVNCGEIKIHLTILDSYTRQPGLILYNSTFKVQYMCSKCSTDSCPFSNFHEWFVNLAAAVLTINILLFLKVRDFRILCRKIS